MKDFDKIDKCKYLLVTELFEPGENELIIEVCLGSVSEVEEDLFISDTNLGPAREINFDNKDDVYVIYFDNYISYFVLNASYDQGTMDEFSGNRIREYKNSAFIEFCKQETLGFQINIDKIIRHFEIITERHVISVLTTVPPQIKRKENHGPFASAHNLIKKTFSMY